MRLLIIVLTVLFTQVIASWRAAAEQHPDGLYYLVLTGDQGTINRICGFGDCQRGFNTRIDALNYWVSIESQAFGISIMPIPAALNVAERPLLRCIGDMSCMASVMNRYKDA